MNAPGKSAATGTAINFAGGQITVPASPAFKVLADYTIEFITKWTNNDIVLPFGLFDTAFPYNGPAVFANYSQQGVALTDGRITFRERSDVSYALEFGGGADVHYNDNTYRHFCFVRRGLVLEAWVEGSKVAFMTLPALSNQNNANVMYFMGQPWSQLVKGALDEAAFYAKALDPTRIALHAALALDLRRLAGNAKLDNGSAASVVVARNWSTHAHAAQATPATSGDFEMWVPAGQYDVTIFGPTGYQPITHGPVVASASS